MIAPSKKDLPVSTEYNQKPVIDFLSLNGSLTEEDYYVEGNVFVSVNDSDRWGKIESYPDGDKRYFLKSFRGGRPGEIIPDPYGMFAKANDLSVYTDKRGERFCEYLRVKKSIFESYQQYLQTRNPRQFSGVVQEILNGERL